MNRYSIRTYDARYNAITIKFNLATVTFFRCETRRTFSHLIILCCCCYCCRSCTIRFHQIKSKYNRTEREREGQKPWTQYHILHEKLIAWESNCYDLRKWLCCKEHVWIFHLHLHLYFDCDKSRDVCCVHCYFLSPVLHSHVKMPRSIKSVY